MLDTLLQVWIFGHEEVKLSTLFCFALPLPSEEDLPIKLFLDALWASFVGRQAASSPRRAAKTTPLSLQHVISR